MPLLRLLSSIPFIPLAMGGANPERLNLDLPRLPEAPRIDKGPVLAMRGRLARRMRELMERKAAKA